MFFFILILFGCNENQSTRYFKHTYEDSVRKECIIKDNGDSICSLYYPNGNLMMEYNITEGKHDGVYKEYYENGQVWRIDFFEDGVLNNYCYEYSENGTPMREFFFIQTENESYIKSMFSLKITDFLSQKSVLLKMYLLRVLLI